MGTHNYVDLVGQRFGCLTVIRRDASTRPGIVRWLCRCDHGGVGKPTTKSILSSSLRYGLTTSCGCLRKDAGERRVIDLTGRSFGRLVVIGRTERIRGRVSWKCMCKCGELISATGIALQTGNTKSCGCLNTDNLAAKRENLIGQVFGHLTVIGDAGNRNGTSAWLCRCEYHGCGKEKVVQALNLKSGGTRSCGCYGGRSRRLVDVFGVKLSMHQLADLAGVAYPTIQTRIREGRCPMTGRRP